MGGRGKITEGTGRNKRMPVLKTDEEAEAFLEQDLTDYIWAGNLAPFPEWLRPGAAATAAQRTPKRAKPPKRGVSR